jgi:carbamoyl-phosphate synthase large subunit
MTSTRMTSTRMTSTRMTSIRHLPVRRGRRGSARRRRSIVLELLLTAAICVLGFRFGASWMQVHEAAWVVAFLHLCGTDAVSGVLPGHLLIFRPGGEVLDAVVTASCSAILSLLGLVALTLAVLRSQRWHAVWGVTVACIAVLVVNDARLAASTMAGLWWGGNALLLFHDWVGSLWNFAATLGGFLLMVSLALPESRRAEQDLAGRHTARRPSGWALPGLGYRAAEPAAGGRRTGRSLTGLFYRYLLPDSVARRLAARREAERIDYRLGHLSAAERVEKVRALVGDGLAVHTATLLAVATYDSDPVVLDALADAVAARQWEPVTSHRVATVRLWARGWLLGRRLAADPAGHPAAPSAAVDPSPPLPIPPTPRPPDPPVSPRSFARRPGGAPPHRSEDIR